MTILNPEATRRIVGNLVHEPTQEGRAGIDLTVDSVAVVNGRGALDFGGSEFKRAAAVEREPEFVDSEDDYGWWDVEAGTYRIRYNETVELGDDEIAIVYPNQRLLAAGLQHAAFVVDETTDRLEVLVQSTGPGARLKENCRISTLVAQKIEA